MTTARDELARLIHADQCGCADYAVDDEDASYQRTADVLIAAGYSKPRVVTTVAELDVLPVNSIVGNPRSRIFQKWDSSKEVRCWASVANNGAYWTDEVDLPAIVIYTPKEDKQ